MWHREKARNDPGGDYYTMQLPQSQREEQKSGRCGASDVCLRLAFFGLGSHVLAPFSSPLPPTGGRTFYPFQWW